MKVYQLLIMLLISFASCNGDALPDIKNQFIANWEVGDETQFKIIKTKEDVKFGFSHGKTEMTQIGLHRVTGKSDERYELEWRIIKTIYPEGIEMDPFYTLTYEEMMKAFKIRYVTDKYGQFIELINWEEILNFQFEVMDNIADIIEEDEGVKYEEIKKTRSQMFSSKEQVEAMFIPEIKLLHSYYGNTFETNRISPRDKSISNIFGVKDIFINTLIHVEQIDTVAKVLGGYEDFKMDKRTENKMVLKYANNLRKRYGKVSETGISVDDIEMAIDEKTIFKLDYGNGIVHLISHKKNASIKSEGEDLVRINEIIIEKVK